jgi:dTMP kinase
MPLNNLSLNVGRLIVVEGADGVGKSTQLELLRKKLVASGHTVTMYDFPHKSGGRLGDLIGDFLTGQFGEVTPEFLSLAFSLDRLESKGQLLADLNAGKVVLCDRYVSSNIAFQTAKIDDDDRRKRLRDLLLWLEYDLMNLPRPSVEIVLTARDAYFAEGRHRQRQKDPTRAYMGDLVADIHEDASGLQVRVNNYYNGLVDAYDLKKIAILDEAERRTDPQSLHQRVWEACSTIVNDDGATASSP